MKKIIVSVLAVALAVGSVSLAYASDWDKAGKALAIIEGARILTGGNVDILGNIAGINRGGGLFASRNRGGNRYHSNNSYTCAPTQTWVPHYTWRRVYIPEHEEYSNQYGNVVVEGHYIRCRVEDGGHWE